MHPNPIATWSPRALARTALGFLLAARKYLLPLSGTLYALGYTVWIAYAWLRDLPPRPAFDLQYLVAGLPPFILLCVIVVLVDRAATRGAPLLWGYRSRLSPTQHQRLVVIILALYATVFFFSRSAWLFWIGGVLWLALMLLSSPGEEALQSTVRLWTTSILLAGCVPLLWLYVTGVYGTIPQALGGGRPRCARIIFRVDQVDPVTAARLLDPSIAVAVGGARTIRAADANMGQTLGRLASLDEAQTSLLGRYLVRQATEPVFEPGAWELINAWAPLPAMPIGPLEPDDYRILLNHGVSQAIQDSMTQLAKGLKELIGTATSALNDLDDLSLEANVEVPASRTHTPRQETLNPEDSDSLRAPDLNRMFIGVLWNAALTRLRTWQQDYRVLGQAEILEQQSARSLPNSGSVRSIPVAVWATGEEAVLIGIGPLPPTELSRSVVQGLDWCDPDGD